MNIILLGSTGSIGTQTLDCCDSINCNVVAMSCGGNRLELFEEQIRKYKPKAVSVNDVNAANILKEKISDIKIPVFSGEDGSVKLIETVECDTIVNGIVGAAGMMPTLKAAEMGITIALANKESLVVAGEPIAEACKKSGATILPVDSEHSAIFQCINGANPTVDDIYVAQNKVRRLILTASGGAFFGKTKAELKNMTAENALKHPTWSMGSKITIDCATLMNKGFEIIEASRLFGMKDDKIDVVIHRESIIHSMIEFVDSSVLAQLSYPDMRIAIQYAMTYPHRQISPVKPLDFTKLSALTFTEPDYDTFRAPLLCRQVLKEGGTHTAVLNAANEVAVAAFLKGKIGFLQITEFCEKMLNKYENILNPTIEEIKITDKKVRNEII